MFDRNYWQRCRLNSTKRKKCVAKFNLLAVISSTVAHMHQTTRIVPESFLHIIYLTVWNVKQRVRYVWNWWQSIWFDLSLPQLYTFWFIFIPRTISRNAAYDLFVAHKSSTSRGTKAGLTDSLADRDYGRSGLTLWLFVHMGGASLGWLKQRAQYCKYASWQSSSKPRSVTNTQTDSGVSVRHSCQKTWENTVENSQQAQQSKIKLLIQENSKP